MKKFNLVVTKYNKDKKMMVVKDETTKKSGTIWYQEVKEEQETKLLKKLKESMKEDAFGWLGVAAIKCEVEAKSMDDTGTYLVFEEASIKKLAL